MTRQGCHGCFCCHCSEGCRSHPAREAWMWGSPQRALWGVNAQQLVWGHVGVGGWKSSVRGQRSACGPVSPGDSPSTPRREPRDAGQSRPHPGPHLALMRYWARLMLAGVPVMVIWRSDDPSVALAILICAPDICRISLILVPWRPIMQPISWKKGCRSVLERIRCGLSVAETQGELGVPLSWSLPLLPQEARLQSCWRVGALRPRL